MAGVEIVPDAHPHQEYQGGNKPVILGRKGQRIVIAEHQKHDRQGEIVVVGRAELGDFAVFRVCCTPLLQVFHDDPLIGHDDEKHICRHDRGGKGSQMQKRCAPGENLIIAIGHDHQQDEQKNHQEGRLFAKPGFAQEIVDQPTNGQRGGGNQDALPDRKIGLGWVDHVKLCPGPIDDHQKRRSRKPGGIAFPFEPDQVLGHVIGRDQVFLNVIKAASVYLPFFAMRAGRKMRGLAQAKVKRHEIERRPDPGHRGDDMQPPHGKAKPVPDDSEILHFLLLRSLWATLLHRAIAL